MGVDEHGEHAQGLVILDEAHATHVGGEIVDFVGASRGSLAVFLEVQIEREIFDIFEALVPLMERLDVDGANGLVATGAKRRYEMAANEPAGSRDHY